MSFDGDGWEDPSFDISYVNAVNECNYAVWTPLEKVIEKADLNVFRPKCKSQKARPRFSRNTDDDDYRSILNQLHDSDSEDSWEDEESHKIYFRPPLQVQRNQFVNRTLLDFCQQTRDISKLCIMGCGEMSLERQLLGMLGHLGVRMVLSVDIDEESLSVGHQLLEKAIDEQRPQIVLEKGFPVLMRSFYGNIVEADYRFANADCIVSMEVIEHMPLMEARAFISSVLGVLKPRMFIFSTPNHDYNEAFGEKPGTFRHDDHKFEMTASVFHDYIEELRKLFPDYDIEDPIYIGMTEGFERLNGATQAAICRIRQEVAPFVHHHDLPYLSTGQLMVPVGFQPVTYRVLKKAFIDFLKTTELRADELRKSPFDTKYWLVDISKILHHINAPMEFVGRIDPALALKMIKKMTNMKVFGERDATTHCLIIPEHLTKEIIFQELEFS